MKTQLIPLLAAALAASAATQSPLAPYANDLALLANLDSTTGTPIDSLPGTRLHRHALPAPAARPTPLLLPPPAVDLDTLKQKLIDEFSGRVIGYAFAISRNGDIRRAGAGGYARRPGDGNLEMTTHTRANVASVSKTITAIAVLQLLEKNGLTLTHRIAPHLPPAWTRGYGFANDSSGLTFKDLLSHTSGLLQRFDGMTQDQKDKWNNDWDGLEFIARKGVKAADVGKYGYKNANMSFFKIIIPILWMKSLNNPWQNMDAATAGILHMAYITNYVFAPAGITSSVGCYSQPDVRFAAAYDIYDVAVPTSPGNLLFRDFPYCGGHSNWHLSVRQLCNIAMHADTSNYPFIPKANQLLSNQAAFARDQFKLGWDRNSGSGKYWHGGLLFAGANREMSAAVVKLPDGINVAVIANSASTDGRSPASKILSAYANSL
ncbi:MAG: beta-lactamase family protein [Planctomycetes bacterium]|nr:beta-lactamase family protein [Planctomycetota bacterium]